jgi:hypothetical protein
VTIAIAKNKIIWKLFMMYDVDGSLPL